jgi:acetate kinase
VREGATSGLEYMGVKMDQTRNRSCRATEAVLSTDDSPVTVCCIPTDEELMIALDTQAL